MAQLFNNLWCSNLWYRRNDDKKDTLQRLSHSTKTPEDCETWFAIFCYLALFLWLQVVKCSNVRHFPSPSSICKCCGCVFFRGYHHIICQPLLKKGVPCVSKTYHWGAGGGGEYYSLWPRREENSLTFCYIKSECPGHPRGGDRGFKWLDWCSDPFFKSCKNDKRNSDLFFKVMRKRETKFKSVFQSNAKKKIEFHIRFSKWCENEKRNTKFKTVFQS